MRRAQQGFVDGVPSFSTFGDAGLRLICLARADAFNADRLDERKRVDRAAIDTNEAKREAVADDARWRNAAGKGAALQEQGASQWGQRELGRATRMGRCDGD